MEKGLKEKFSIGTIVAHYNNYGYVAEIHRDKVLVLYPYEAPDMHEEIIADFDGSKWPLRIVQGQKVTVEEIKRMLDLFQEFERLDRIFDTEVEDLKRSPEYGHLLTEDNGGGRRSLAEENIRRHLKKHFPKGQFRIAQLASSEAIEVTWRNTSKCTVDQRRLELLLMPFLWGVTDDDGGYVHVRNPFATVFGGVFHIEFRAPRHVD